MPLQPAVHDNPRASRYEIDVDGRLATADYIRESDVNTMMEDVKRLVKDNPGPALLAAAAVGFLLGRSFTSND